MEKESKILDKIVENIQTENNDNKEINVESQHYNLQVMDKNNPLLEEKLLNAIFSDNHSSQNSDLLESQFEEKIIIAKNKKKEFKKEFYEYLRKQSKYIF